MEPHPARRREAGHGLTHDPQGARDLDVRVVGMPAGLSNRTVPVDASGDGSRIGKICGTCWVASDRTAWFTWFGTVRMLRDRPGPDVCRALPTPVLEVLIAAVSASIVFDCARSQP